MTDNPEQIKVQISKDLLIKDLVGNLVQDLEAAIHAESWGVAASTAETIANIMKEIGGEE